MRTSCQAFLQQQAAAGVANSVIFTAPGVRVEYVVIDWLHTMDLGLCQTVLGNALFELLEFLEGSTLVARAGNLWKLVESLGKQQKTNLLEI